MSRAARRTVRRRQSDLTSSLSDPTSRLRAVGIVVLCLKLGLVPLVFDPSADVPFVLPRTLLSHGLTYILVGVLAALFVAKGPSFLVRSWVHVPVLAFLCISALATVVAVNPTLALYGTHVRMLGLTSLADCVITYFAIVQLVRERRDVLAVIGTILASSLVMLVYEAIQLLGKDPIVWPGIDTSQRPFSTAGQPTTLGEYLSVLSMGTLALGLLIPRLPSLLRAGLVGYAAVLILAAGLTGTRAAAVGVVAAAGVFVILIWAKHPSRRARLLGLISGLGAAAMLAGLLLLTPLGTRFLSTFESPNAAPSEEGSAGQLELSAGTRLAIYNVSARMVIDRPLLGYGPDNFAAALPAYRPEGAPPQIRQSVVTSTHGWIAAVATGSGMLGLAAFLAAIGTAGLVLLRSAYSGMAVAAAVVVGAYLGSGAVTINALETDTLFWLGLAAIAGATASRPIVEHATETRSARHRAGASDPAVPAWIPWLVVVAAIALAGTAFPALDASHLAQRSVSARTPATAGSAIDMAKQATQRDPNRAEYWQQLALAYVAGSRWTDASIAFQSGAKLAPYDIRFLTDGIQVQLVLARNGDGKALERAQQLADQAVSIDANNPNAHLNRAVVLYQRGDSARALESIDRALMLDPNSINGQLPSIAVQIYIAVTQSSVSSGRFDDAIATAQHGIALLGANAASVPLRIELARALVRGGRTREALDVLDAALAIVPTDQSLLQLKAEILRAAQ